MRGVGQSKRRREGGELHVQTAGKGFVMFSVTSSLKTEQAREVTKDERLLDFRKAALIVVN